jgi:hypothetical protein
MACRFGLPRRCRRPRRLHAAQVGFAVYGTGGALSVTQK